MSRASKRLLLVALVSSALAIYMSVGAVLVAVRAQRHFSAGAWVIWVGIALATVWLAVRSWRKVRAAVADERAAAPPRSTASNAGDG